MPRLLPIRASCPLGAIERRERSSAINGASGEGDPSTSAFNVLIRAIQRPSPTRESLNHPSLCLNEYSRSARLQFMQTELN